MNRLVCMHNQVSCPKSRFLFFTLQDFWISLIWRTGQWWFLISLPIDWSSDDSTSELFALLYGNSSAQIYWIFVESGVTYWRCPTSKSTINSVPYMCFCVSSVSSFVMIYEVTFVIWGMSNGFKHIQCVHINFGVCISLIMVS